jgi:hypothetical protein
VERSCGPISVVSADGGAYRLGLATPATAAAARVSL